MAIIDPLERTAILQALQAGVVPKRGLRHIQVGRAKEVEQVVKDFRTAEAGGSIFRIFTGPYGSGKTFFLELARQIALKLGFVVLQADLAPDRRLFGTKGVARSLMQEMTSNVAIEGADGIAAWKAVLDRLMDRSREQGGGPSLRKNVADLTMELQDRVGGYDFTNVIRQYVEGFESNDQQKMDAALRWLRAEYRTQSDARSSLGVRSIITDENIYEHWKNLNALVKLAGFRGVFICLDELVNIYKLPVARSREQNYEQILRILNDIAQSAVNGMVVYLGGTPEFVSDPRRGCFSYEALKSRLKPNEFLTAGLVDFAGPVVPLEALSQEDYFVLLENIRRVIANDNNPERLIDQDGLNAFMAHCDSKIGAQYFRTPRESIRSFVQLLSTIEQNPDTTWRSLLPAASVAEDQGGDNDKANDDLEDFTL